MIKPIETVYNGIKFRSRLEARWAIFFDAARIDYLYEAEGYKGFNDEWYLPDFFLPKFGVHCEVKPNDEELFKDRYKLGALIDFDSSPISNGLIILGQIPFYEADIPNGNIEYPAHDMLYWDEGVVLKRVRFKMRRHNYPTELITVEDFIDSNTLEIPNKTTTNATLYDESGAGDKDTGLEWYAYMAARQARFEHGETPTPKQVRETMFDVI